MPFVLDSSIEKSALSLAVFLDTVSKTAYYEGCAYTKQLQFLGWEGPGQWRRHSA
jgi:hypothetical protein